MATEVTLPQLGESVTEGTITAWLVEVGDKVEADQPLFELSSDKIDTEVPAPASGVLTEIKVGVDETVDVGTVVAIISDADEAPASGDGAEPAAEEPAAEPSEEPAPEPAAEEAQTDAPAAEPAPAPAAAQAPAEQPAPAAEEPSGPPELASPLVRRLADENSVDLSAIKGSGQGGRITREDVEAAISAGPAQRPAAAPAAAAPAAAPAQAAPAATAPRRTGEGRSRVEDLSRIRQRIAAKMMESLSSSAQLTTVQEVDVTGIMNARAAAKDEFKAREGVSLSPFAFLCRATILALRHHPKLNALADWEAGTVTYHDYVNLGIAVDTEKGLIVPNIKNADDLALNGLARAIAEAANKARGKGRLEMTDIEGATFTMTNTGSVGVLIDTPILNYPEVAILGTGAIRKRPVVLESDGGPVIAIRDMMYLSLTYDHRLIDGADAARFVTEVKRIAETHDWAGELGY